jgi:hypothetical protein
MADAPSREALQRADKLAALIDSPVMEVLIEEARRKAERDEKSLTVRAKSAEGVEHAEWRYWAGFQAGMEYLLNLPNAAQRKLDKINNPAGGEQ